MTLAFESRLNILLSELLQSLGVVSRAELLNNKGRRDVVVYHQGLAIVLEGSYSRGDAENDAKKRIEQLSADVALAIHYPSVFPQELAEHELRQKLREATFAVRVIVPEDISGTLFQLLEQKKVIAKSLEDWHRLDLNTLASLIREVGQFIISDEVVKKAEDDVSDLVQKFVSFLSSHHQSSTIAGNLYDVLYKLYGFSIGRPSEIKELIFAQAGLAILLSSIYYESIRYAHSLESLRSLASADDPQQALETAVANILKIDYEPIFEAAREMLRAFPQMPMLFGNLVDLASEIATKRTLLRRDLAGKVYHRVVGDWSLRKGLATFYTEIPAAYLLLHLAKPKLFRIADFACGSGTLLVAAYSAANTQHRFSLLTEGIDKDPEQIATEFHAEFIKSCYGFDVLDYATQITALNLAFHSPETPLQEFSVYTMPLGYREEDKSVSLGSLEFAKGSLDQIFREVTKAGVTEKTKEIMGKLLALEPFDMVVMNPPFTRATGRGSRVGGGLFGFIADEKVRDKVVNAFEELRDGIRRALRAETKIPPVFRDLLKGRDFQPYLGIGQAGEGLLFLYLANMRVKEDGKICFVLPKSLLTGVSWFLARALLASRYHVEYLIVSYDSKNGYNFSESTSLSECLLVAKRVKEHQGNEVTKFVTLLSKPRTSVEGIALANEIEVGEDYVQAGSAKAFIIRTRREEMLEQLDNWGRFVFLPNLGLLKETKDLLKGVLRVGDAQKEIPLTKLNRLITSLGIDAHQFADSFKLITLITGSVPGSLRVVYGGEEEMRRKMAVCPNAYVFPKNAKGKALFEEKAGRLLVPDRIRVTTAHAVSMMSDKPTLSNIFYALRLKDDDSNKLKVLCLWLNTSWGILTTLASREETEGGWIRLKMSQWRLLPVLNVDELSRDKLKRLAQLYDEFKDADLGRIPEQYGVKGEVSKSRVALDLSFLKVMGMPTTEYDLLSFYKEIASSLRQWLGE